MVSSFTHTSGLSQSSIICIITYFLENLEQIWSYMLVNRTLGNQNQDYELKIWGQPGLYTELSKKKCKGTKEERKEKLRVLFYVSGKMGMAQTLIWLLYIIHELVISVPFECVQYYVSATHNTPMGHSLNQRMWIIIKLISSKWLQEKNSYLYPME